MINSKYSSCENCPYNNALHLDEVHYKIRKLPVPPEINNSKTLLIFQSPGLDEWRTGRPISSKNNRSAAHKIESAFNLLRKSRKDFDITNAIQCYTGKKPNNNISKPRDRSVSKLASKICKARLENLIAHGNYENLIVFGTVAKSSVEKFDLPNNISVSFSKHPSARGISVNSIAILLNNKKIPMIS